ncbi:MAG: hypothetical protein ACPGJV_08430 [Bacteriovoracaceae bacterium]
MTYKTLNQVTFSVLLLSLISCSSTEKLGYQAMPGQIDEEIEQKLYSNDSNKEKNEPAPHLVTSQKSSEFAGDEKMKSDKTAHFFPQKDNSKYAGNVQKFGQFNIANPGETQVSSYEVTSDSGFMTAIHNEGKSTFSFVYMTDNYDYQDRNDIFNRTFREGSNSLNLGTFFFNLKNRMNKTLYYGFNLGIGYNRGYGYFAPPIAEESTTEFKLWTIPMEFEVGLTLRPSKYVGISLGGAYGGMLLLQSRDDRKDTDASKDRRQVGHGYSANGALSFTLSSFFPSLGRDIYSLYKATRMSLDFYMRHQSYSTFSDTDIQISGSTYGMGITFEYL